MMSIESLEFKHNFSTTQPVCTSTCVHAYRVVLIKEHTLLQSGINGKNIYNFIYMNRFGTDRYVHNKQGSNHEC